MTATGTVFHNDALRTPAKQINKLMVNCSKPVHFSTIGHAGRAEPFLGAPHGLEASQGPKPAPGAPLGGRAGVSHSETAAEGLCAVMN